MKTYYLLAPLGAIALAGCTVYRPVAYEPVATAPATVAVAPTYVVPSPTVGNALDSDGDGYSNSVDQFPSDARYH
jgi:hypothetical protein